MGDLEEQMKQMEEEDEKEQSELRSRIQQLEADVEKYSHLILSWREQYQELEASLEREKELRLNAEFEVNELREGRGSNNDAIRLPSTVVMSLSSNLGQRSPSHGVMLNDGNKEIPMGCGNCSMDSRCECIEQAFDMGNITADMTLPSSKRPPSPSSPTDIKRSRQASYEAGNEDEATEIDFTARFATKRPLPLTTAESGSSISAMACRDSCGFCQDDTVCICAEMAAEVATSTEFKSDMKIQVPFATDTSRNPSLLQQNPCINGPGTCAQCLASPTSTLFCKSLAAMWSNPSAEALSMNSMLNGNESVTAAPSTGSAATLSSEAVPGITLSCADTFATLSRHPAFDRASDELGAWMPKLTTVPGGVERTSLEVEAASVMGILKFFDRRFGRDTS